MPEKLPDYYLNLAFSLFTTENYPETCLEIVKHQEWIGAINKEMFLKN